jgi:hypothetical protein
MIGHEVGNSWEDDSNHLLEEDLVGPFLVVAWEVLVEALVVPCVQGRARLGNKVHPKKTESNYTIKDIRYKLYHTTILP